MTIMEVNPELLVLARKARGLAQGRLAKMAQITQATLSRFENGLQQVPDDILIRLSDTLNYPLEFFYRRPTLLGMVGGAIFHRKFQSMPTKKLYQAHACAEVRRLEIITLLRSLGITPPIAPEYSVEYYDDDPAKIARSTRAALNIPPGPIFNLTETLERNGYMVVAHDFGTRYLDGFSQRPQYPPHFIHINEELPPDRWRWTLAHEMGHLVMHFDPAASPKTVEKQANLFAAEFLTPANEIAPMLTGLNIQKAAGLKREWKVSMQALITHAYHLEAISGNQRASLFIQLSKAGYRVREPETLDPPVERPTWMKQLAREHLEERQYSLDELTALMAITKDEFAKHYTDSVWASIDSILQDF